MTDGGPRSSPVDGAVEGPDIRPGDAASVPRRNIKLTIAYEGTSYFGWQRQRGQDTVQEEVEKAASRVVDHPVVLHGSGRTDRGVHALGQVANFHTPKAIPAGKLLLGINTYLPDDIRVRAVEEEAPDFHARYSARGKRYRYTFLRGEVEEVLVRRFCALVPVPVDVAAMREAAAGIRGMRDFRAFEGASKRRPPAPGEPPRSTVRTVAGVVVGEVERFITIDAFGRGFLYGMVRAIAGTLLEVGTGRRSPESIEDVLASADRTRAGHTAPARGLCLLSVYYAEGELEDAFRAAAEEGEERDASVRDQVRFLKLFS